MTQGIAELEAELTTHYVKNKIDATTGPGHALNVATTWQFCASSENGWDKEER